MVLVGFGTTSEFATHLNPCISNSRNYNKDVETISICVADLGKMHLSIPMQQTNPE